MTANTVSGECLHFRVGLEEVLVGALVAVEGEVGALLADLAVVDRKRRVRQRVGNLVAAASAANGEAEA